MQNPVHARDQAIGGFAVVHVFRGEGSAPGSLFNVNAIEQSRSRRNDHDNQASQPVAGMHLDRQKDQEHCQAGRMAGGIARVPRSRSVPGLCLLRVAMAISASQANQPQIIICHSREIPRRFRTGRTVTGILVVFGADGLGSSPKDTFADTLGAVSGVSGFRDLIELLADLADVEDGVQFFVLAFDVQAKFVARFL